MIHFHKDTGWQNGFYNERVTHYIKVTPPDSTATPVNIEELKKRFAEHLMTKGNELDTSDGYAVEWTVKNLNP